MRTPPRLPFRLSLLLTLLCPLLAGAQQLRFTTLDIGQGDSAVLVAPGGCAVLFDGGPTGSGDTIKAYLKQLGVTRINLAFVSHMHADHMGGIDEVDVGTDAVPITAVYDHGGAYDSKTFTEYDTHFAGRRFTAHRGDTFSLCGQVTLTVVASNGNGVSTDDENAKSVVVKVTYGAFDALVGGDLTSTPDDIESTLLEQVGELELYKVHHHGSRYSSGDAFLDKTVPLVSFISVGWNNTYGHPTRECLDRLTAHHSDIWQTEDPATSQERGHIELRSQDGATFVVEQGARSVSYTSRGDTQPPGPDTERPTPPRSLAGSAAPDSIELSWSPSLDNVGVAGYRVYRNVYGTTGYRLAGTTVTPGFVDLGLAPGNTYTYQVLAFDAAGNSSMPASITLRTPLPRVTLTSPDGGERWIRGSTRTITWIAIGYTRVNLDFTADNGVTWTSIATSLDASTGSHAWKVPDSPTALARVRIRDVDGKSSDVSTGPFSITEPPPRVIFNEILANEPGSNTNGEFVELVNTESTSVDISGWVIMDATAVRHVFPANTVLGAGKAIAVFSGTSGIPAGTPNAVAASTGTLSLNNGGDTVTLLTSTASNAATVNTYTYSGTQASKDGVSINRDPDATSTGSFVFHTALSPLGASPGTRVDGSAF
ncbi:lamin tail domain-containing protein [Cystobacter fuscus]|uniref:lamin tail domain-containing protein n=1 Tax=Cystobacter fuscus TaxID=43 RepID=UPI002B312A2C|nr:MBL fold metallo-hydrolase [Cystobacter fuscus]